MTNARTPGKRGDAEDLFDRLTHAEIMERVQAAAAKHDAQRTPRGKGGAEGRPKQAYFKPGEGRDLQAGLKLANELIAAKGGAAPVGVSYEQYISEYQAAKVPQEASA